MCYYKFKMALQYLHKLLMLILEQLALKITSIHMHKTRN